jgi:hypothetical protein
MALIDFDKLAKEYDSVENDFGFSAVSEEEYKARLAEVEKIVIPFLTKLHSTGDKEYIYWPNRKPIIEAQIEKILKLTKD